MAYVCGNRGFTIAIVTICRSAYGMLTICYFISLEQRMFDFKYTVILFRNECVAFMNWWKFLFNYN